MSHRVQCQNTMFRFFYLIRYKVHYVGYGQRFDEWKKEEELVKLTGESQPGESRVVV